MLKVLYIKDGIQYYIENMTTSVKWSGDIKVPFRSLSVDVVNSNPHTNDTSPLYTFECGREIRLYENGNELFRGVIFNVEVDERGKTNIEAHDEGKYLLNNQDTRILKNSTASNFVKKVCKEFGINTGVITDTKYVIKSQIYRSNTLWDIFQRAITKTRDETGRRYWMYTMNGKIHLVERKDQIVRWVLEDDANLMSASRRVNIDELRNSIKVVSGDIDEKKTPKTYVAKDNASISKYGMMQQVESVGELSSAKLNERAKYLLKDLNKPQIDIDVTALGISSVYAGRAVYVYDKMTGLNGGYYVQTDSHSWENGNHTMSLSLSYTDELPFVDLFSEEEEKKRNYAKEYTTKKSPTGSSGKGGDKTTSKKNTTAPKKPSEWTRINPETGLWE